MCELTADMSYSGNRLHCMHGVALSDALCSSPFSSPSIVAMDRLYHMYGVTLVACLVHQIDWSELWSPVTVATTS
jgi:hypothetical protein